MAGLGGERAYRGRLGNDWNPGESRHSIASLRIAGRFERQDVLAGRALAMPRPCVHQLAPPRQRIRSPIGLLGLVADYSVVYSKIITG